mgnify:CR=1 FL=1
MTHHKDESFFCGKVCFPYWACACLTPIALILLAHFLLPRYVYKNITHNTVWYGTVILTKPIYVHNGARLIIKPNTVVICKDKSALVICKDGQLKAEGKQNKAIVFTPACFGTTTWYGIKILGINYNNDPSSVDTFEELALTGPIFKASPYNYECVTKITPNAFKVGNVDNVNGRNSNMRFVKVLDAGDGEPYYNVVVHGEGPSNDLSEADLTNNISAISSYQGTGNMDTIYVSNAVFNGVLLSDGNMSLRNSVVLNSGNYSIATRNNWAENIDEKLIDTVFALSGNVNENDLRVDAGQDDNYLDIVYVNYVGTVSLSPSSKAILPEITTQIQPALSMHRS